MVLRAADNFIFIHLNEDCLIHTDHGLTNINLNLSGIKASILPLSNLAELSLSMILLSLPKLTSTFNYILTFLSPIFPNKTKVDHNVESPVPTRFNGVYPNSTQRTSLIPT